MCGIYGYFDRLNRKLDDRTLAAMGSEMRHRGPDDEGIYRQQSAAIGNLRLSIIDLAGGHQPFVSDDGAVAVVQNGEIYNYIELAKELEGSAHACRTGSDTETILRLYLRDGIDFLSKLNGMFAIAILDTRINTLFLARDRVGVKPLFLHDDGTRVLFGSEIKSLLKAGVPRHANVDALDSFLTYNYVPPPVTAFRNVVHVEPGTYVAVNARGCRAASWWSLADQSPDRSRTEQDWIEEFRALIDDAVRIRMRADVPFGAFLSGGVDSSTVVAHMSRHSAHPVRTFCIGFDDARYDESPFAEEAATRFRTQHLMEKVSPNLFDRWDRATWHCDQPHGDVSFLPTLRLSELAVRHVKMVLTGDGGDELFAGYTKYRDFFEQAEAGAAPDGEFALNYARHLSLMSADMRRRLYAPWMRSRVHGAAEQRVVQLMDRASHFDRINRALYVDMMLLLPGNNLVKPDRMGMAVSLEARTPFLDYRMVEFAFRMPGSLKLFNGEMKYLYKKAVGDAIGHSLAYRKKQMFTVPVGEWFKSELLPMCREFLLAGDSSLRTLFDAGVMRELLESHLNGSANRTREIRALLAIALWLKVFQVELDGAG